MARLTREQSQARTKAKLLASAREVVAREGYEGATIERIAEEAGFSKGAFYSNFNGKEDIFLYLLETHAGEDVVELQELLGPIEDPRELIDTLSSWAQERSTDPSWGMLALELFRHARRNATFGERHSNLFRAQWEGLGKILLRMFPEGEAPAGPTALGGIVFELTYGAASSFTNGPTVGELVKVALTSMYEAYGAKEEAS
ncbi:Transcriptional regulator, TetR family (plasmid) [Sinorhizobium sojae CCBAU 05684]|uniref:Transcriptional regulator, TetR family n=1 Tax=Sinorhizobium sojae CCBAU 05684 TaxID=716928 RepID=A0A249PL62_9HYPH|nr:TetR/AcrR family transcriptional regulator [Sinorhizobium sojae]ASY66492.1 Transcriptional regulator, TetR family [Sinorhizobium sojae CCBAU 05684]